MRRFTVALIIPFLLLVTSCFPTPPPELRFTPTPEPSATSTSTSEQPREPTPTPVLVEIGGRTVSVNRIVEGLLCDDVWQGTIYVSPDVLVNPWTDDPTFLRDCDLQIAEGTVVHVATHPGEVFYRGCTCHQ